MVDVDTFLTMLYVMVDDFCTAALPAEPHPGPPAALAQAPAPRAGWGTPDRRDRVRQALPHLPSGSGAPA